MHVYTDVYVHTYIYICTGTCAYTYADWHTDLCNLYAYMYIHLSIRYIYINTYIHMRRQMHTRTHKCSLLYCSAVPGTLMCFFDVVWCQAMQCNANFIQRSGSKRTVLYCTVRRRMIRHCAAQEFRAMEWTKICCTKIGCSAVSKCTGCIVTYFSALDVLCCTVLHCTVPYCSEVHRVPYSCIVLHCTEMPWNAIQPQHDAYRLEGSEGPPSPQS